MRATVSPSVRLPARERARVALSRLRRHLSGRCRRGHLPQLRLATGRARVGAVAIARLRIAGVGICAAALVASCAPAATKQGPAPALTPQAPPSATNPPHRKGARVEIRATGTVRDRLAASIADLQRMELWRPLTRHLYVVKLAARPGRANVPPDAHLADAVRSAYVDDRGQGLLCDIVVYPAAVTADLERWRDYHAAGLLSEAPPTLADFWTSIVAHEIAHCLEHRAPEARAVRWERRVLARLQQETPRG